MMPLIQRKVKISQMKIIGWMTYFSFCNYIFHYYIVWTRIRPSAQWRWMMAQQTQNNIFVKEWILQVKDSVNQVWAILDWIRARKIRKHNLKGITLIGQVQGCSVLIFTQVYLSTRCPILFLLFFLDFVPHFSQGPFLYIVIFFSIPTFHLLIM